MMKDHTNGSCIPDGERITSIDITYDHTDGSCTPHNKLITLIYPSHHATNISYRRILCFLRLVSYRWILHTRRQTYHTKHTILGYSSATTVLKLSMMTECQVWQKNYWNFMVNPLFKAIQADSPTGTELLSVSISLFSARRRLMELDQKFCPTWSASRVHFTQVHSSFSLMVP